MLTCVGIMWRGDLGKFFYYNKLYYNKLKFILTLYFQQHLVNV